MRKFETGRFLLFLLIGLIVGTVFGILIGKVLPFFAYGLDFGIPTLNLDLVFLNLTFGLKLQVNIGTVIGVILFLLLFAIT
jgi:hypothetical protein